jgi:hypothetical protein
VGRGVVTVPKGRVVRIGGGKGFCLFLFFEGKGKLEHRGRRKGQGLRRDRRGIVRGSRTRGEGEERGAGPGKRGTKLQGREGSTESLTRLGI